MWTWCQERDKTSLGIHERGWEFVVTTGSICQIWWGLHSSSMKWLVRGRRRPLFSFSSPGWHVCGHACAQVCVWTSLRWYMLCVWQERVPAECTWKRLEINWGCWGLLETVQHACQCVYTCRHLCVFEWKCVVCTPSFICASVEVLKYTCKEYKIGT